ncbi:MAG: chromate transporter [Acidobacteriota bacterium]
MHFTWQPRQEAVLIKNYLAFLKVGFLGFGGGVAMLPLLEEIARDQAQIDSDGFVQIVAISQTFPGPLGINAAGILGYRIGGWMGAVLAILGIAIPSFMCAAALFYFLGSVAKYKYLQDALQALKAALVGVVFGMVANLGRKSWSGVIECMIGIAAVLLFYFCRVNPIWLLIGGGFLGLILLSHRQEV